ncbi:hypothetical protein SAMN04487846_3447 [Microbacterium sp. cf046]|uniref:hypothetical protein n=1 Tax=Microbacterium sp. cf046 TaxID=1761803 RepID=UPI0008ED89EF|nr:hypothetical protein [Microbacterium sp. cf046]SFS17090.1 hypothetical protein SAMN04487846_3447 [Microbacterium sp. cf046]
MNNLAGGFLRFVGIPIAFVALVIAFGPEPVFAKVFGIVGGLAIAFVVYLVIWRVSAKRETRESQERAELRQIRERVAPAVRRRDLRNERNRNVGEN